ncbi:MAG: mannose-1-phosphate guanylyltransferase/mannose-6-phosphate isomerase [Alphaproteobacteria bacterium]|nr:mannose-1-phosphate guanylyltransferase/mannose-6-phosphate isomerase [Alphaproteobacteria bacterium]
MTTDRQDKIQPVILSGGAGTRLWPQSRELYPKQLLALLDEYSLLQMTAQRVLDFDRFTAPIVVCNHEHRFIVAEQLREIGVEQAIIMVEPEGRNTAPAAAAAAELALKSDNDAVILILPSDHAIDKPGHLMDAVARGEATARAGGLVAFGIAPDRAETGYGYLHRGELVSGSDGVFHLRRFVEKPDRKTAEELVADGHHLWNAGIFLFSAQRYLSELAQLEPEIAAATSAALREARQDIDFLWLDPDEFSKSPSNSIDYAVMERIDDAFIVETDLGWNDLGSWQSLWQIGPKDENGNVLTGDVIVQGVTRSYIHASGQLVTATGIDNMAVVATGDAVLVVPLERAQDVKSIVERLKTDERPEASVHSRVYRPWGYYQGIDLDTNFQVKRIAVYPGRRLSLQKHAHRAEHWIVVEGTAIVTCDDETFELDKNQSTFIPLGAVHRLENRGPGLLKLIEVQSGDYLGEDDIVRLEDAYGRT